MPTGKYLKKLFFTVVFSLLIAFGSPTADASAIGQRDMQSSENGQTEIFHEGDGNSEEVDYVLESDIAQEMRRARKEKDAKTYDSFGGGISIIAMCIVVGVLAVLSILFMIFGKISSRFMKKKKKIAASKTSKVKNNGDVEEDHSLDSGETIAAITAALAQHFDRNHDIENTILTIHKMRKAYSPWNSKIYNMRHVPEVAHHNPSSKNISKK